MGSLGPLLRLLTVRPVHVVGVGSLSLQLRLAVPSLSAMGEPLCHCFVEVRLVDRQFPNDVVGLVTISHDLRSPGDHLVRHPCQWETSRVTCVVRLQALYAGIVMACLWLASYVNI